MIRWFVPGRLEVFGKHTDYAGGRSILAAVDRGVTIELSDFDGPGIVATSTAVSGEITVLPHQDLDLPAGHWGHYIKAVADRLVLNFGEIKPARIAVDSTLPLASGMSSSSALVVAVALALIDHNGLREDPRWLATVLDDVDLAGYMACFENGMPFKELAGFKGVGTFGGSEDHTAMLCCRENQLSEFSFCPIVERGAVDFPDEWSFVVAVSGVLAEKTGDALEAYNDASLLARELVEEWNSATGRDDAVLADALATEDGLEGMRAIAASDPELVARLNAFVTESEVAIPRAMEAFRTRDLKALGDAADLSHRNADATLGNQIAETNALQELARGLGAHAAAGFGAGFGGSVWALIETDKAEDFAAHWLAAYKAQFPEPGSRATTLVTRPGPAAHRAL
ncbi:GHMP family kinase ATP-binding protein [Tessaracoccus caeni]|uniref:GHMP family kinase ATP-binding protein n=1 Tax=Tessaracoccus caeni TaxID=3031239 RepID=UPI0023D98853|nr:galactokinase family protein [Tessaracoccus caeni]MDF1487074.1 galactokinase family protein [Tessaracoccus caeni]